MTQLRSQMLEEIQRRNLSEARVFCLTVASSACSLPNSSRRSGSRPFTMDRLAAEILFAS